MKRFLIAATLAAAALSTPTYATDVGVSVTIGEPGFYGRIDIGDYPYPQPRVIYRQPRVIERIVVEREPVYLRVPPGHRKHWSKHCRHYRACGERVYFVQDDWYQRDFVPHYRERHHDRWSDRHDDRRDHDHGHNGSDRHDRDHDRDHDRRHDR